MLCAKAKCFYAHIVI